MGFATSLRYAAGAAGLALAPQALAATGISALGAIWDVLIWLGIFCAYVGLFVALMVYIRGRGSRIALVIVFFAGLLFVPPFEFAQHVSFHYVQPVDNLPPGIVQEPVEILGTHMLRRQSGELVYLPDRYGGNANYWELLRRGAQANITDASDGGLEIRIYDRKRDYEFRDLQKAKYGRNVVTIPLFAFEVPRYRILEMSARRLPADWRADGEMLFFAAGNDSDPNWLRDLIERGADLHYVDPVLGQTPLHRAFENGQFDLATVLLAAGARTDATDKKGRSAVDLLLAQYLHPSGGGDRPEIRKLLKRTQNDWHASGAMLLTALHAKSDRKWISYLLERGAPIDYRDPGNGNTALHLAVLNRQFDSARLLLRRGAQKDISNKDGITPGGYLRQIIDRPGDNDSPVKLRALLKSIEPEWKVTGLMLHMREEDPARIRELLRQGADPEYKNGNGDNALQNAIRVKNYGNAIALVQGGAKLTGTNGSGLDLEQSLTMFIGAESPEKRKQRKQLLALIRSLQ